MLPLLLSLTSSNSWQKSGALLCAMKEVASIESSTKTLRSTVRSASSSLKSGGVGSASQKRPPGAYEPSSRRNVMMAMV